MNADDPEATIPVDPWPADSLPDTTIELGAEVVPDPRIARLATWAAARRSESEAVTGAVPAVAGPPPPRPRRRWRRPVAVLVGLAAVALTATLIAASWHSVILPGLGSIGGGPGSGGGVGSGSGGGVGGAGPTATSTARPAGPAATPGASATASTQSSASPSPSAGPSSKSATPTPSRTRDEVCALANAVESLPLAIAPRICPSPTLPSV